jgi:hypothetical protein
MKGYKPEVTNPQHTKLEIFKGKVKDKYLNLRLEFCFQTNCFRQLINRKNCIMNYQNSSPWKWLIEATKVYRPEATNTQHN